jgi:hypothetical protein
MSGTPVNGPRMMSHRSHATSHVRVSPGFDRPPWQGSAAGGALLHGLCGDVRDDHLAAEALVRLVAGDYLGDPTEYVLFTSKPWQRSG